MRQRSGLVTLEQAVDEIVHEVRLPDAVTSAAIRRKCFEKLRAIGGSRICVTNRCTAVSIRSINLSTRSGARRRIKPNLSRRDFSRRDRHSW